MRQAAAAVGGCGVSVRDCGVEPLPMPADAAQLERYRYLAYRSSPQNVMSDGHILEAAMASVCLSAFPMVSFYIHRQ